MARRKCSQLNGTNICAKLTVSSLPPTPTPPPTTTPDDKYNAAARKLSKRLKQLGASELVPLGLGDDQATHGYLTALVPWTEGLRGALQARGWLAAAPGSGELLAAAPPDYEVEVVVESVFTSSSSSSSYPGSMGAAGCARLSFAPPARCKLAPGSQPLLARVASNTRQTEASWRQDVRHLVLDLAAQGSGLDELRAKSVEWPLVAAGDVATIHPCNPTDVVARAVALLAACPAAAAAAAAAAQATGGWTAQTLLRIRSASGSDESDGGRRNRLRPPPHPVTVGELLEMHLDLCGLPRRSFFQGLAPFATDADERDKLLELASPEGTDLYYDYCVREKRSYVEVLEEFRSARPPLERLLELLPPLQPRHYSIASSGHCAPAPAPAAGAAAAAELHLCVAVVESVTPYGRRRKGVCSAFLASRQPGDLVVLWVRRGAFVCPPPEQPVLCVGPGTGVAPMRAVLQERVGRAATAPSVLFFGCRKQSADFLFGSEWRALDAGSGGSSALLSSDVPDGDAHSNAASQVAVTTAFSQDGPADAAKTYVQAKIRLHGRLVWRLLQAGAVVLVSGSARRMPRDVRRAICAAIEEHGGLDAQAAERFVLGLEASRRYIVEAWS